MRGWLLFLLLPLCLQAERFWQADLKDPFMLTIQMSPQALTLGDSLQLEIEVHYPPSYQLDREALIDQLTWATNPFSPQWDLIDSKSNAFAIEKEIEGERLKIRLIPLTTGPITLPPLRVTFSPKEKGFSAVEVDTPSFSFEIPSPSLATSLPLAPLIPLDPQFPLGLTEANRRLWIENPQAWEREKEQMRSELAAHSFPWLSCAILLGCGGVGWFLYVMRDHWAKRLMPSTPPLSAQQIIDQAMQAFEKQSFSQEHPALYYAALSSLLYAVIQVRLQGNVQAWTTAELEQALREQKAFSPSQIEEVISILTEIDQVKFGNKRALPSEAKNMQKRVEWAIKALS